MEWISVKDRLPKFKQYNQYLISDGKNISIAWYGMTCSGPLVFDWFMLKDFKHLKKIKYWMLIPELPKAPQK